MDAAKTVVIATGSERRATARDAAAVAGFRVAAECADVAATLAAIAELHPDVCILDRELPGGGITAIAAIAVPGQPPRVVVVGGDTAAEKRAALLAGADECVPQAAGTADLAASLAAALRRRKHT